MAKADVLLEPVRRDSGAGDCRRRHLCTPRWRQSDPVSDPAAFAKVCSFAGEAALDDQIVMFGAKPTRPATGYGYIRPGPAVRPGLFEIERFVV